MSDYYRESIADLPLFRPAAPAVRKSDTSVAAAASLSPETLNALQQRVYEFLLSCDGATDEEMQRALRMNPSTQRPRRIELVRQRLVVEHGTRKTQSGRSAVVWKAVERSASV